MAVAGGLAGRVNKWPGPNRLLARIIQARMVGAWATSLSEAGRARERGRDP
jgi:hypothetical protein